MIRPHVTDHALLRYLERVIGIDVSAHRRAIERSIWEAANAGASGITRDGMRYVIDGPRLVTVMAAKSETAKSKRRVRTAE